jgi:signal transduction histidine kinase
MAKPRKQLLFSVISTLLISIIGYVDWITGYEFSVTIFYLFPITLLALYKDATKVQLIINSLIAAIVWMIADVYARHAYSNILFLYWETFARFIVSIIISLLIYKLRKEHSNLTESNEKLKKLNEEKNTFLGIAAHDLKNPITTINIISETLLDKKNINLMNPDDMIKMIHEANKKSLDLINGLLDVSRIESGTINVKLQRLKYVNFAKKWIEINQLLATKKEIDIILEAENYGIEAQFDSVYMEEVFNNLLTNAIKYSYKNGKIKVRISKLEDKVLTEIIDNGVGISENEISNLFQPFTKSSSKPTYGESSTGLGLTIVKKIISLHNGEVGIKSKLNEGTNVYFFLSA